MKRHTDKIIIVEGKYDKIRLSNIIDGVIITTDGFGIFNNEEKRNLIKKTAKEKGIIILTDSDSAGNVIRSHIATLTGKEGIKNVYAPRIKGKEKRKKTPSKEGVVGIEGTLDSVLLEILEKAGAFENCDFETSQFLTKADLYRMGYYGTKDAAEKRKELLKKHSLPENLSPTAFLDAVNLMKLIEKQ